MMKTSTKFAAIILLIFSIVSCIGPQIKVGQSTMEDVRNQFGAPTTVEKKNGVTEWIYHVHDRQLSDRVYNLKKYCTKDMFLFNDAEILIIREVSRRDEFCPLIQD